MVLVAGPDSVGAFRRVGFKGIHNNRCAVTSAQAGQSCSFALKKVKRCEVRKGMVMLDEKTAPKSTWQFTYESSNAPPRATDDGDKDDAAHH